MLLECAIKTTNSYVSLNFGIIQSCRKTTLAGDADVSLKREPLPYELITKNCFCRVDFRSPFQRLLSAGDLCGEPHTKLEFTVLTRYQPDKEMNVKKTPIVKVISNLRAYLMLMRTVKGLADSPLCAMVLNPQIADYKMKPTHQRLTHKVS